METANGAFWTADVIQILGMDRGKVLMSLIAPIAVQVLEKALKQSHLYKNVQLHCYIMLTAYILNLSAIPYSSKFYITRTLLASLRWNERAG